MAEWYKKKDNPRYKIWTQEEIRVLGRLVEQGCTFPDLGRIFRRNPVAVYNKACREGFHVPRRRKWTAAEEQLLKNQYFDMPRGKVAKLLGRTVNAIGHRKHLLRTKKAG